MDQSSCIDPKCVCACLLVFHFISQEILIFFFPIKWKFCFLNRTANWYFDKKRETEIIAYFLVIPKC